MSDLSKEPKSPSNDVSSSSTAEQGAIFSEPAKESSHRGLLLGMIVLAVVAIGAGLFLPRRADKAAAKAPNTILPADPAAKALVFSQLAMSQSTSLSGQTSTFLDGHIKNTGSGTLTAATIQVVFRNDVGLSPQVELLPLSVIRMREPYIDTEPVGAAPIKPGDEAEFRLVFESIPENWNQQMPEVQVVHATLR
jgi:hypothetical protein